LFSDNKWKFQESYKTVDVKIQLVLMVDNSIEVLFKSKQYAYVQYGHPIGQIAKKFIYANGKDLEYGDKAEILSAVVGDGSFWDFIKSALSETYFTREHFWFTCGYQPTDFDNEEIKQGEVRIHYAGVDNTILKRDFYELCLLLCEAKKYSLDYKEELENELLQIKLQLEEKLKAVQ
jgi:hypothetical protein